MSTQRARVMTELEQLETTIATALRMPSVHSEFQSTCVTENSCVACGRAFASDEIIYRARTSRPSMFGRSYRLCSFCEKCVPKWRKFNYPQSCAGCRRQVSLQLD